MLKKRLANKKGFTLIELMIVVSIIGILAAIAVPNYRWGIFRAKEAVLRETLYTFRTTIDQYYADQSNSGQGKYPDSLQEMADKKYLRGVPKDPIEPGKDWVIIAPPAPEDGSQVNGSVYDVHSGSNQVGSNGIPYNEW
jgi:general secretion pathway protein G